MGHLKGLVRACLVASLAGLTACGGGSESHADPGDTAGSLPAAPDAPPSGLYVGYYAEDPVTNPEDPTYGAFQLFFPEDAADFAGSMFFTYEGCQSSNVGAVRGSRVGGSISGLFAGDVDGVPQHGRYQGAFDSVTHSYSGTYSIDGGKQYRNLLPCIDYYIAPNGTFEMHRVGESQPRDFRVSMNGRNVQWSSLNGAGLTLVYVLDPVASTARPATTNPVIWQGLLEGASVLTLPATVSLRSGTEYIAAVAVGAMNQRPMAFGSVRFVMP